VTDGAMTLKTRWRVFYILVAVLILGVFANYQHPDAVPSSRAPGPDASRAASGPGSRALCLASVRLVVGIKEAQEAGVSLDDEISQVTADNSAESDALENAQKLVTKIYGDHMTPGEERDIYLANCDSHFPAMP
jgi:hypothetical protein